MRMPANMMRRLFMSHANGLAGAGPELYGHPKRRLEDRNPVSRAIPFSPFVPLNPMQGAGTATGCYQRTAPYVYNAQPVVISNGFGGAGTVVGGSRLGPLAASTQVGPANS